ncbi:hypothetical protein VP1G_11488 [Cytospora mali]|nr:hypothetical protein VP1G_11488 [Valsa mali var. pyri (nom. inval.)]
MGHAFVRPVFRFGFLASGYMRMAHAAVDRQSMTHMLSLFQLRLRAEATSGSLAGGAGVVWAAATTAFTLVCASVSPLSEFVSELESESESEPESVSSSSDEVDVDVDVEAAESEDPVVDAKIARSSNSSSSGRPVFLGPDDPGNDGGVGVVGVMVDVRVMV